MRSTIILRFLALLVVTVIIAACSPTPTKPVVVTEPVVTPSVEVRLVGWRSSPAEEELQRSLLDHCGVTYELETDYGEYWDRLQVMFAAGEEFDILYVDTVRFPSFADQGFLAPLDDAPAIRRDEFIDTLVSAFTFKGTTYGIPRDSNTLALFYNRDLFAEAGLEEPTDDWTWDDLAEAAQVITEYIGVPGFSVPAYASRFSIFVFQNGGRIMTEDFSDTLIDSGEAIEAGMFYTDARWEGWAIIPEDVGVSWDGEAFGKGDVAMVLGWFGMIRDLSDQFPDLNYGAVHPPAGREEGNLVYATAYAVSDNSSAPQAALDAIACLTSEESQIEVMKSGVALPSRKSLDGHPYLQDNPVANAIFTGAKFATPYTWGPRHEEVDSIIAQALERVYQGEMTVEESFWQAAEEIRAVTGE